MVLPSNDQSSATERQNDFLDFFSQAIERYKKSAKECGDEETDEAKPSPPRQQGPPKKRSAAHVIVSDESSAENPTKVRKTAAAPTDDAGSGSGSEEKPIEAGADVEKKRLASRVSSRRTREREKLRMDHFRNAKVKLIQENKKLKDENGEIRSLILNIKEEKEFLERKTAAVQSMLTQNPPAPAVPTQLPQLPLQVQVQGPPVLAAPAVPMPQPQPQPSLAAPSQPNMAAMLLNALVQAQGRGAQAAPSMPAPQPSQEQQLLSLLGLVSANPALAQLLAPLGQQRVQQVPKQQPLPQHNNDNNMLAALLQGGGNFGGGGAPAPPPPQDNSMALNQNLLSLLLSGGGQSVGSHNNSNHFPGGYMSMDSSRSM